MFSNDWANDESCINAKEKVCRWEKEREDSINLEENIDGFDGFSMPNDESYSPMISHFDSCETSSKRAKIPSQMVEMLEKQKDIFQSGVNNVAARIRQWNEIAKEGIAIMMQGHKIAKERLAIKERGHSHCYSEEKVFLELVNIGILLNIQLDAMLFLIKDPSKMTALFWCSN